MSRRVQRFHTEQGDGVLIGPGWQPVDLVIGIAMLAITVAGAVAMTEAAYQFFTSSRRVSAILTCVFLLCWYAMSVNAIIGLSWRFVGRETVGVAGGILTHSRTLFGYTSVRQFDLMSIRNIRIAETPYRLKGHPMLRRRFAFDYNGETIFSTSQLTEEDGRAVLEGCLELFNKKKVG